MIAFGKLGTTICPSEVKMWVDKDGIFHTVALPDPTDLMADVFRASLTSLKREVGSLIDDVVADGQDAFFDQFSEWPSSDAAEKSFEGLPPPGELLSTEVGSANELKEMVAHVSPRWRLDVWLALEDFLDSLPNGETS